MDFKPTREVLNKIFFDIMSSIDSCLVYWEKMGERHTLNELTKILADTHRVSVCLTKAIASLYLKHHPDYMLERGINCGIVPRKSKNEMPNL